MPSSSASAETLSQVFIRSSAIRRNAFGYLFTRFFVPTRSLFPGWVSSSRVSHSRGSVHQAKTKRSLCTVGEFDALFHAAQTVANPLRDIDFYVGGGGRV
jgi:hypothetical protein